MDGRQNLKSLKDRAPEDARRIQSAGGKKSAEARRRKKAFKDQAQMILSLRPRAQKKLERQWRELGYDVEADGLPTVAERLAMSLAMRAEDGDDQALRMLMSYSHNPTMAEKLEGDKIKAMDKGRTLDVNVNREDAGIMDDIRAMMDGTTSSVAADAAPPSPGGKASSSVASDSAPPSPGGKATASVAADAAPPSPGGKATASVAADAATHSAEGAAP